MIQFLKAEAAGYEKVGYDIRNLHNYGIDLGEANTAHEQFFVENLQRKREVNPSF